LDYYPYLVVKVRSYPLTNGYCLTVTNKAGVIIHVSATHIPLPIKYNRSYPLTHCLDY
jgi:hypothetical protein